MVYTAMTMIYMYHLDLHSGTKYGSMITA
jgi:hypothetical protein